MAAACAGLWAVTSVTSAIASPTTQEERFAAAFGAPEPGDERAVCDAIPRIPGKPVPPTPSEGEATAGNAAAQDVPGGAPATLAAVPAPRFLASVGVPVAHTRYDDRWRDVAEAGLSFDCASFVLDRTGPPASREELAAFNRLVNGIVSYVEDAGPDAWAPAADTLRTGRGDCEDIAILKLQLLLAVGLPEDAAYFTLVRDTMRQRDHAVLVVRLDGHGWALDSIDDALLDADREAPAYQAVMAFSGAGKWLLGSASPPYRSVMAVPSALRTGFRR